MVLDEICNAFNSGYKYIVLEAPTGFGKSAVAIALALSLGSSYILYFYKGFANSIFKRFSIY